VIATSGMQADMAVLFKVLRIRSEQYFHAHDRMLGTEAFAQLLSNTLYYKRFFPYYTFNVVAGLDEQGEIENFPLLIYLFFSLANFCGGEGEGECANVISFGSHQFHYFFLTHYCVYRSRLCVFIRCRRHLGASSIQLFGYRFCTCPPGPRQPGLHAVINKKSMNLHLFCFPFFTPCENDQVGHHNITIAPPELTKEQAIKLVQDTMLSAGERDIYTGDFCEMIVLDAQGAHKMHFNLKLD
jgi:hypothetical protein